MRDKLYEINYVIKDYTDDNFSEVFKTNIPPNDKDDIRLIAEEIAEWYWSQDPCDAKNFSAVIGVKSIAKIFWFNITADYSVNFYATEVEDES